MAAFQHPRSATASVGSKHGPVSSRLTPPHPPASESAGAGLPCPRPPCPRPAAGEVPEPGRGGPGRPVPASISRALGRRRRHKRRHRAGGAGGARRREPAAGPGPPSPSFRWGCCCCCRCRRARAPEPAGRPTSSSVLADDLGWNDVGFHGSAIRTPRSGRAGGWRGAAGQLLHAAAVHALAEPAAHRPLPGTQRPRCPPGPRAFRSGPWVPRASTAGCVPGLTREGAPLARRPRLLLPGPQPAEVCACPRPRARPTPNRVLSAPLRSRGVFCLRFSEGPWDWLLGNASCGGTESVGSYLSGLCLAALNWEDGERREGPPEWEQGEMGNQESWGAGRVWCGRGAR